MYTQQLSALDRDALRALADFQMTASIYDVAVTSQDGISINNPWYDETARFALATDEESVEYYGVDLFEEWCRRGMAYISQRRQ